MTPSAKDHPGSGRWQLEKRPYTAVWVDLLSVGVAIVGAILVSAAIMASTGANAGKALWALYRGAFGSWPTFLETLVQATPLIYTGLATVVAFRAKVWNIGGEGQFFAGAIVASWVSLRFAMLPGPLLLLLVILAAMAGGALWAMVPGFLRARHGTNEIITTVMMNYVITFVLTYLLSGVWNAPGDHYLQTPKFATATFLPVFFGSRLHLGFFLALLAAVVVYVLLWRTSFGYELRAIGVNSIAARYKGIDVRKTILLAMLLSGALAGLCAGSELAGVQHRLRMDISLGYGFLGILVAMIGRLHPIGVIFAGIFFGALLNGSTAMQVSTGVPVAMVNTTQGIVLVFMIMAEAAAHYRLRRVHEHGD